MPAAAAAAATVGGTGGSGYGTLVGDREALRQPSLQLAVWLLSLVMDETEVRACVSYCLDLLPLVLAVALLFLHANGLLLMCRNTTV